MASRVNCVCRSLKSNILFRPRFSLPVSPIVSQRFGIEQRVNLSTTTPGSLRQNIGQSTKDEIYKPAPLYAFQDISKRDMLIIEMRYHRIPWNTISEWFGADAMDVWWAYIAVAPTAIRHNWTSKMTLLDIEHYLEQSRWNDTQPLAKE